MLGARDEAAEFDEMDSATPAEMFNDDPRLEIKHKLTKVRFFHLCPGLNISIVIVSGIV